MNINIIWSSGVPDRTKSVAVSEGKVLQVTKGEFTLMGNWPI